MGSFCCKNSCDTFKIVGKKNTLNLSSLIIEHDYNNIQQIIEEDNNQIEVIINDDNNEIHEEEKNDQFNEEKNNQESNNLYEIINDNSSFSLGLMTISDSRRKKSNVKNENINEQNNKKKRFNNRKPLSAGELKVKMSIFSNDRSLNLQSEIFLLKEEEVSQRILYEINEARLNPLKYFIKIEKYSKDYCTDFSNKNNYLINNNDENQKFKINLKRGKIAFWECISLLKNLPEKMKKENYKLEKLSQIDELKFPFPKDDLKMIDNEDFIDFCINEIKNKVSGRYIMVAFNYYVSFIDIEPLAVLHFLDDCDENKIIQKAILSPDVKYVGINFCKIKEGLYIVYYVYAQ